MNIFNRNTGRHGEIGTYTYTGAYKRFYRRNKLNFVNTVMDLKYKWIHNCIKKYIPIYISLSFSIFKVKVRFLPKYFCFSG